MRMSMRSGFNPVGMRYEPDTIMAVAMVASVLIGGYSAYESSQQAKKMSKMDVSLPPTPNPADALATAQSAADARRRTILNAGGNTNLTGSSILAPKQPSAAKTLLGA